MLTDQFMPLFHMLVNVTSITPILFFATWHVRKTKHLNSRNIILGRLCSPTAFFHKCLEMVRSIIKRAKKQGAFLNIAQMIFTPNVLN